MSNVLILSENTVFKEDLSAQISYHIPDFEIVEDKSLADIIIIDENISFLSDISDTSNAPVIFIGKENISDSTKIHMFVQKPLLLGKFIDDIKASINIYENSTEGNIEFNKYILYPTRKEIYNKRDNSITKLTEKEVAIIKYLYKNSSRIISKSDLMQEVWDYSADVATHTVETHIYRLRQKVEQDNVDNQFILTSDGGYQLKI